MGPLRKHYSKHEKKKHYWGGWRLLGGTDFDICWRGALRFCQYFEGVPRFCKILFLIYFFKSSNKAIAHTYGGFFTMLRKGTQILPSLGGGTQILSIFGGSQ